MMITFQTLNKWKMGCGGKYEGQLPDSPYTRQMRSPLTQTGKLSGDFGPVSVTDFSNSMI